VADWSLVTPKSGEGTDLLGLDLLDQDSRDGTPSSKQTMWIAARRLAVWGVGPRPFPHPKGLDRVAAVLCMKIGGQECSILVMLRTNNAIKNVARLRSHRMSCRSLDP
jgi:hypothetical protein